MHGFGYTEETFLQENGFESKEDLIDFMKLNYRTNLYYLDYFRTLIPEENIKKYYNENEIYGEIKTKHILVQVSEDTKEKQLAKANEIIGKLEEGKSFDDVATEYADNLTIISEDVNFDWSDANSLAEEYVIASKKLEKNSYTKEPVLTDFGYHIIYCVDKAEKPSFEEAEDDIVQNLGKDLELEDNLIRYKALIKLREDYGLKFKDAKFKEEYKEYCDKINTSEE